MESSRGTVTQLSEGPAVSPVLTHRKRKEQQRKQPHPVFTGLP